MRHLPLAAALFAGCLSENDVFTQQGIDTFSQAPSNEIDILWVVDDSYSMGNEQARLADGFASFAAELDDSGTDFHIGVVTTSFDTADRAVLIGDPPYLTRDDDYVRLFQERATVGVEGSDKEEGLAVASLAVSPNMANTGGLNEYFVRPAAQLVVMIVSDEEDCSDEGALDGQPPEACYWQRDQLTPVAKYLNDLHNRKDTDDLVTVNAIVGLPDSGCDDVWTGSRYIEAASQTGGHVGDICEASWDAMLGTMGLWVASIRDQFQLSKGAVPGTLQVEVDEVRVTANSVDGWTYDARTRYVQFHGDAIPPRGSTIVVTYTIDPGYVAP